VNDDKDQVEAGFSDRDFEWKASQITGTEVRGNLPLVDLGWRVQAQTRLWKLFNYFSVIHFGSCSNETNHCAE
jgi:hypothetical protein